MNGNPVENNPFENMPQTEVIAHDNGGYTNRGAGSLNSTSGTRDNKGALIAVAALAVLLIALIVFFVLDPMGIFSSKDSEPSKEQTPVENTSNEVNSNSAGTAQQDDTDKEVSITINSFDTEQFPNNTFYAQITSKGGFTDTLGVSSLSVVEIDSTGAEHTCKISGVVPTSSNSTSFKINYTSSLPISDGSTRTVRLSTAQGSGYEGWAEKTYVPPVQQQEEQQEQPANTSQDQNGDTTVVIVMPEGSQNTTGSSTTSVPSTVISYSNDYILPESSMRLYSISELSRLTDTELELARNEIFARHGRGFNTDYIRDYFRSKSWYVERYSPEYFDTYVDNLNSIERENIRRIQSLE